MLLCIVVRAYRIEGFHNIGVIRTGAPTLLPKVWFINPMTTMLCVSWCEPVGLKHFTTLALSALVRQHCSQSSKAMDLQH
jgi:hypothetical protein